MTDVTHRSPTLSQAAGNEAAGRRFVVRLVLISILIPISFDMLGFRFTPALLVLVALFPFLIGRLIAGQGGKIRMIDALFVLYIGWASLAIYLNTPDRFVTYVGQQGLVVLGGYLVGRTMILDREDFASFLRTGILLVIVSLPFAIHEALTGNPLILHFVRDFTPFDTFSENNYEARMGLLRAQWVFVHPIHYGIFCALFFMPALLAFKARKAAFGRWTIAALVAAACFMSVSSGPVLSMFLQVGLFVTYLGARRFYELPWRPILMGSAVLYIVLELASTKSAFVAISSRLAFNSGTAYYRTLIWRYGTEQVQRTPIFGNGFNYWPRPPWMTPSVDNFWLAVAMVHGLPALLFFVLAILLALVAVNRRDFRGNPDLEAMRLAWTISLVGFAMIASTVALWNEILIILLMLFGAGQWMLQAQPGTAADAAPAEPIQTSRFTRFPVGTGSATRREPTRASGRDVYARSHGG